MASYLCHQGVHLIAKLLTGVYACSYCHAQFHEHHAIQVQAQSSAAPHEPPRLTLGPEQEVSHGRDE